MSDLISKFQLTSMDDIVELAMTMLENEIKSDFCLTAFPDCFVKQGKTEVILNEYNLDGEGMLKVIRGIVNEQ